jgi:autotransporter-associated beta strand protein
MKLRLGLGVGQVALCFCFCALGFTSAATAANKPNIIMIMSDDAGFASFGFSAAQLGQPTNADTPNLDALAAQSIVLKQGYVADSVCSTSRAGLLTGQYAQRYGFEDNITGGVNAIANAGDQGLNAQQITMAQHLKGLGYSTGAIGKWHQGYVDGYNRPQDKGFDEFFGFLGGGRQYFASGGDEAIMRRGDTIVETAWRNEGDKSRYDPVKGRYVTDALGEEAVSFINNHANDANPFFLYLAFNAPHSVWDAKQSDLDHFAHLPDPARRMEAAMNYALDRAVGDVMGSLQANGIKDDTIVVFMNDNGPAPTVFNEGHSYPLRGFKGSSSEGGIRVPFIIHLPGVQPHVYEAPLDAHDLLPTFYAAAGGDPSTLDVDGHDMTPYLTGAATEDPNHVRFWRSFDTWAVRKGDWKLTIPYRPGAPGKFLFNIKTNPTENVYYESLMPLKVAELTRELTNWEATLAKPKWGALGARTQNLNDHFVFRNDLATSTNWSVANGWREGGTANNKTLQTTDAYANAIIEFSVRNDADYTANNDMRRVSRETFMLNQMRLTGDFQGTVNRQGSLTGLPVLFVKSLTGQLPKIRLDAVANSSPANFTFQVNNELQLLHDLEITGDGTQDFVINGRIRDYYEPQEPNVTVPHSVRKTGLSTVQLTANNTFRGAMTVEEGSVIVNGPNAAINGAEGIDIQAEGKFTLQSGTVAVNWIKNNAGGSFDFNGGTLKVVDVDGNLANHGGIYSPGASPALSSVSGNLEQDAGSFVIELGGFGGALSDSLAVGGTATLGSTLQVNLLNGFTPSRGQTFQFLTADGGITGTFANTVLPSLPAGLRWNIFYNQNITALAVVGLVGGGAGGFEGRLPGDYNRDGTVDTADYTVYRNALVDGNLAADGNFDGVVTGNDFRIWKAAYGLTLTDNGNASIGTLPVPEPSLAMLALSGALIYICGEAVGSSRIRRIC